MNGEHGRKVRVLPFFPKSSMLWGLCAIRISVCSGGAGALPGRNRDPRTGSGISFRNRIPGTRGIKKVAGSRDSVPTLLIFLCTVYFQSILLYFENVISPCESELLGVESVIFLLCKYTSLVLCHHAWEKKRW